MSIDDRYDVTVSKKGLLLMAKPDHHGSIALSAADALELLQRLYSKRDRLLAGADPAFNAVTHSYLCPLCKKSQVPLEIDALRWRGYCVGCSRSFELDVTGQLIAKLRQL